jgi:protein-S-isoprenylcysteine O-methyltransferase Ste14
MIDRTLAIRALGLYLPMLLATALGWRRLKTPTPRRIAAVLAGVGWCLPWLLALQLLNLRFGWWVFHAHGGMIRGMPADMLLGWTVLWGALPILAFPRVKAGIAVATFIAIDLLLMPLCAPVVELSPRWLIGESVAVILVLVPAQLFSRWTWHESNLAGRGLLWAVTAVALLLFLLPELVFAVTGREGWRHAWATPSWLRSLELQAAVLVGLPALSAAQEFVRRGQGSPIPFDPPQRLVSSGLYRYIASPMQISGTLVIMAWGLLLGDRWLIAAGPVVFIYGAGLAHWHENVDMQRRFGEAWLAYSRHVPAWRPRWKPWHDPSAPTPRLYIAEGCGPCSEVSRWFEHRQPIALELVAAEDHPDFDLSRITYDPCDGTPPEHGVVAFARGLEHINFGWALFGALVRLPGVNQFVQILLDAVGFGPQTIARRQCSLNNTELESKSFGEGKRLPS